MTDVDGWKGPNKTPPPGPLGPIVAMLRKLQADVRALQNAAPNRAASISEGGLTIRDGGNLTIQDGGGVQIEDGGDLRIVGGGNFEIEDGGDVVVHEGGRLTAQWADGSIATMFGPQYLDSSPTVLESIGLLVQATEADDNRDVFRAKTVLATGSKEVFVGQSDNDGNVDVFFVFSDSTGITGRNGASLRSAAGQVVVQAGTNLFLEAGAAGGNGIIQLRIPGTSPHSARRVEIVDGDHLVADFDSGGFHLHEVSNTSNPANAFINTDGRFWKSTSSRRFKQDIEDHGFDLDAILALRPRTWRDRGEVEIDPDTTKRYAGFVAEEVHDLGLTEAVIYETDGTPLALADRPLIAGLVQLAQRQEAQLTEQAAQIAALTARLDALDRGTAPDPTRKDTP